MIIRKASTFYGRINITDNNHNGVLLSENDYLIFTVKKNAFDETENPIIKKIIPSDRQIDGGYCFELTPEETNLPTGDYFFDIGVQRENGEFYHIYTVEKFIIYPSVSRKEV